MLKSIIRSKVTRKILGLFFSNPNNKFYIRELERMTCEPVSAVRRELRVLEQAGILFSKEEGKVIYYWVNKENPIYEELKGIIFKTQAIGNALRDLIKKIPDVRIVFIYGSVAKNEETALSDVDLMVIGDIDSVKLHEEINKIENKIKRTINYTLIKEEEVKYKKTNFVNRVLKEKKIFLIGNEDELKKLT